MSEERPMTREGLLAAMTGIEELARRATPGPWRLDHGHVVAGEVKQQRTENPDGTTTTKYVDKRFDVLMEPWEAKQAVRGVNPGNWLNGNARYAAAVYPEKMLRMIAAVRELISENEALREHNDRLMKINVMETERADKFEDWLNEERERST
jgi:hypothetical protein